ncbi:MAG: thioester domain-containing protein [Solirubrobacterales bacterium]|nr:thioester domain-containing protein [Solirubrobacterales bacterium]
MWEGGLGPGRGVTGFIPDANNPFDPVADGYPAQNPTTDWSTKDEGFAGVIHGTPTDGSPEVSLYCIDINTDTYPGYGYVLGTWDAANVTNVGYVARLLNEYYPNTDEPASLPDLNERAAAVQAAIWFFSDRFVLSTSDPLHDTVAAIAAHIIKEGPLVEPPPPSLTLTPTEVSGGAGSVLGPFTVTTDAPAGATVNVTGGNMYSKQAGTHFIADGATVPSGKKIWVRSTGPPTVELQATSKATVHSGNVYLYDGNGGADAAQKLILAKTATLTAIVNASAEFLPSGSLVVKKTIAGPAAGSQGRVVIRVSCDDGVSRLPFIIPAGARAGTRSRIYRHIPAGTMCTVTETANGSVVGTEVVVTGDGQQVTIHAHKRKTVKITDTYHYVGSLLVRKTIAGPGAGLQGSVTIHTVCNGTALTPDFVIPAGSPAGDKTKQYDGIRVPSKCTVTETADGHNGTVSVVVEGSGQTVSVPPRDVVEADISDTYGLLPGQLEVTKTIAGPLAGQQGSVVIHTVCNGTALTPDFVIPAGTPAGDQSYIYSGILAPASCVVTETADGHTTAVSAVVSGSPQTTTIPPGGAGAAHITDTYGATPGSLLITKTIAGPLAGHQGPVTIHVTCNGTALSPDFVIPARARAGSVSRSYDGIPAGSVCTVTETADGATATVTATVSGDGQTVAVPAGEVVPVNVADVYEDTPGSLKVTKTIAGPAARHHGPIAIQVACGGPLNDFMFLIPARIGPGSVSRVFDGLPAGSRCTVTEVGDGHTRTVAVVASPRRKTVTIRASGTVTAHLTDTYHSKAPIPPGRG